MKREIRVRHLALSHLRFLLYHNRPKLFFPFSDEKSRSFAPRKTLPGLLSLQVDNSALTPIGSGSLQLPGGEAQAEAAEVVNEAQVSVESYRGNAVTKNAEPDNPAVHNAQPENDVAKKPSEIEVEEKDSENADASKKRDEDKEMKDAEKRDGDGDGEGEGKPEENGEVKVGEKRQHDATDKEENGEKNAEAEAEAEAEANAEETAVKKQKTDEGSVKKSRGRPKKSEANGTPKKTPTKKREPKKAATQTGEPRRSARHKSS